MDISPPLYTTLYPSSANIVEAPPHSPVPSYGITSTEYPSIRRLLLSIQEQTAALRRDVLSKLPQAPCSPPSPPLCSAIDTSPLDAHTATTAAAGAVEVNSHVDTEFWGHLIRQQQTIVNTLSKALHRLVVYPPKKAEGTEKASQTMKERTLETKSVSIGQQTDDSKFSNVVDLVDLLNAFYSSTAAQCGQCGTQLPHTIVEAIIAAAMRTTTHDVQDTYSRLLVNQIGGNISLDSAHHRNHNASYVSTTSGSSTPWHRNDRTVLRADMLVALPLPVASTVLREVPFPLETIAYRMARSVCDAHHRRQSNTVPLGASRWPASQVHTLHCRCSPADAVAILDSIRFLWLPLRFLEAEEEREQRVLQQQCMGAAQCSVWSGLLLRLQQAARAKRNYMAQATETHGIAYPLQVELRRVRASYEFLTDWERQQLLDGARIDVPQLLMMQKRCDGEDYDSAPV